MLITRKLLATAKGSNGGLNKKQKELIRNTYKLSGVLDFIGMDVDEEFWIRVLKLKGSAKALGAVNSNAHKKYKALIAKNRANAPKVLNKVSVNTKDDWSWQPDKKDIPPIKLKARKGNKSKGKKKELRAKISRLQNAEFYKSREWRSLRVRVLEKYICKCMMCGRSPSLHRIVIHVDHIKPRSKYPELSLDFENLQLLCEDCNLGKSNKYETDWRPE